ncbi:MAG: ABC transporter ATP-binding protein [Sphaerochaetaceae bacterium]|nr:ABC transporter ATP-binding protein [Sphaerochaetaceae bacterium]
MLRRFISYYRPYKGLFFMDMGTAVLSAVLSIVFPALTRELLKTYVPESDWRAMFIVFCLMLAIYLVQMGSNYIRIRWGHILGVKMENDMRAELFDHLQSLSFGYFDKVKTGHMMSRITNDLFQITEIAHHGPEDLLISVLTIVGAYAVMFSYSVPLSLVSMIPLPFMLFYGIHYGLKMKEKFRAVRRTVADVNSTVENSLQGIREVKSFTQEQYQNNKFGEVNDILKTSKEEQYKVMASYHAVLGFFRDFYYFTTVVGGAVLIYYHVIPVYDLVTFILYVGIVLPPLDRLIQFTEQLQQGIASFERFIEVLDVKPDITDVPDAKELAVTEGAVRYDHVRFSYDDASGQVLGNLALDIPGGSTVAFVGESGAGKTTIASLLPRFYEPNSGRILIDGQDISKVTQSSLRRQIGFVQQNVFLFDASIRENLRYGKSDATEAEMWTALDAANLGQFVRELPDGLETQVGERGTRLSGGQKQRLSIARVFLKNPAILIFDEATSSLDTESEAQIQDAFDRLSRGRTAIVIAHRLTTVKDADHIFVIDKGTLAETGTHEELLARGGHYARLYHNQDFS